MFACDEILDDNGPVRNLGFSAPPRHRLVAPGYDPNSYISTSQLVPITYVSQAQISARFGGLAALIQATDDDGNGQLGQAVLDAVIAAVTAEINGYLSTIYPIPFSRVGTEGIVQVTDVDANGVVTSIAMVEPGCYQTAPVVNQTLVYLRQLDPLVLARFTQGSQNLWNCQTGSGLQLTVTYGNANQVMIGGSLQTPKTVTGTPVIANGGTAYNVGDLLVLTGGSSYVPDKATNAAITLCCFELQRRRLSAGEDNTFESDAMKIKKELQAIGHGEYELDGLFKRFYAPVGAWNEDMVMNTNSL